MKKALLLTLSLGLLFSLPSCQNQDAEKKIVNITFGRLYDKDKSEKIENHLDIINYAELTTLVESNKEFVLFVYDKNNAKWADYEKTILGFTEKENAIINAIDRKSFKEGYDLFGLSIKEGEETFAAFSDGKLVVQRDAELIRAPAVAGREDFVVDVDVVEVVVSRHAKPLLRTVVVRLVDGDC